MTKEELSSFVRKVAKVRKLHLEYLNKHDHASLRQAIALLPKCIDDIDKHFAATLTVHYKWQERFISLSTDYLHNFAFSFKSKQGWSSLTESGKLLDNSLDWLFKNDLKEQEPQTLFPSETN